LIEKTKMPSRYTYLAGLAARRGRNNATTGNAGTHAPPPLVAARNAPPPPAPPPSPFLFGYNAAGAGPGGRTAVPSPVSQHTKAAQSLLAALTAQNRG